MLRCLYFKHCNRFPNVFFLTLFDWNFSFHWIEKPDRPTLMVWLMITERTNSFFKEFKEKWSHCLYELTQAYTLMSFHQREDSLLELCTVAKNLLQSEMLLLKSCRFYLEVMCTYQDHGAYISLRCRISRRFQIYWRCTLVESENN